MNFSQLLAKPYECFLLVHPDMQVLELTHAALMRHSLPMINIGKDLSSALIETPLSDRGRSARRWFVEQVTQLRPSPVLCSHIDLLFEPGFQLDPLALFRQASRISQLVVLWPGDFSQGVLSYAVAEHRHYRTWQFSDSTLSIHRIENEF